MSDFYENDFLLTNYIPKYIMFILYSINNNGESYQIILQNNILPIFKIHKRFMSKKLTLADDTNTAIYRMLDLKEYIHYVLDLIFDQIADLNHEIFRSNFSDDFLIIDMVIQDNFIINPKLLSNEISNFKFSTKSVPNLNEPYDDTLKSLPPPND